MELILFSFLAIIAVISAVVTILQRNPVHSAVALIVCFLSLAGLYLLLHAEFIAAIQVIIYAGSIMVLFLFVIMLLDLRKEELEQKRKLSLRVSAIILMLILVFEIILIMNVNILTGKPGIWTAEQINAVGNTQVIGKILFANYLYPFEIVSVLLLVALIGAIILGKRKIE
ncbi:MAG: NADH-quinone oxidoreductase subunit J [bacterium]|nr:NADH-quinone oxidoreductase subunit J [bacterium]